MATQFSKIGVGQRNLRPLDVEILLWYYCRAGEFERAHYPEVASTLDQMLAQGFLRRIKPQWGSGVYALTEKGDELVDRILKVEVPE